MSKNDYQALARAFYITREKIEASGPAFAAWEDVRNGVLNVLERDNPNFDPALFIEACETGKCKGMPKRG